MYSILPGRSRVPHNTLSYTGHVSPLSTIPVEEFVPVEDDFIAIEQNLVSIVSKILSASRVYQYLLKQFHNMYSTNTQ